MELSILELVLLFTAAICAGAVDSVVGGGGLISVPMLLLLGVPPLQALATNKLQSVVGKIVAVTRYARAGLFVSFRLRKILWSYVVPCFFTSMLGAFCATRIETRILELLIPIALIAASLLFAVNAYRQRDGGGVVKSAVKVKRGNLKNKKSARYMNLGIFSNLIMYIVSCYDGLFGPGAGTFFLVVLTELKSMGLRASIALSRVLNMSSNLGAILVFSFAAGFVWRALFVMMLGQVLGAWVGSFLALRVSIFALWVIVCLVTMTIAITLLLRGSASY